MNTGNNIVSFLLNAKENIQKIYLQYKEDNEIKNITYQEAYDYALGMADQLYELGLRKGDKVTIIAHNSWQWMMVDKQF